MDSETSIITPNIIEWFEWFAHLYFAHPTQGLKTWSKFAPFAYQTANKTQPQRPRSCSYRPPVAVEVIYWYILDIIASFLGGCIIYMRSFRFVNVCAYPYHVWIAVCWMCLRFGLMWHWRVCILFLCLMLLRVRGFLERPPLRISFWVPNVCLCVCVSWGQSKPFASHPTLLKSSFSKHITQLCLDHDLLPCCWRIRAWLIFGSVPPVIKR